MNIEFNLDNYEIANFTSNAPYRESAPSIRIVDKQSRNFISSTCCRTKEENLEICLMLLYLWQRYDIRADSSCEGRFGYDCCYRYEKNK